MMDEKKYKPCDLVIYGALGDLSRRKLMMSLYQLDKSKLLEPQTRIIGVDRLNETKSGFIEIVHKSLMEFLPTAFEEDVWQRLSARFEYLQLNINDPQEFKKLGALLDQKNRITVNYLAIPPSLFKSVCTGLHKTKLIHKESRLVMEKPIGHDLKSSHEINDTFQAVFKEEQIYRIDHYLGKETVLNLLALRFANSIFTTNWSHDTIDNVQITVAEEVGIEGRWDYFDHSGQLCDMLQNHLLQILTFIAMEPPVSLEAKNIHQEKIKVLKALRPISDWDVSTKTVRGQYTRGYIQGKEVPGYLEEEGANTESSTESFVAMRVDIDNWRWSGVPFYLRTGKRMNRKRTEIIITFKELPHNIFKASFQDLPPNKLVIYLQPKEGVEIEMLSKIPCINGSIRLQKNKLDLSFVDTKKKTRASGGYERLLLEAMRGNNKLFISREETEAAWTWVDSIQHAWSRLSDGPKAYSAGTWGPNAADALLARDGRTWED
ncbi:MAG: glucose-6-phosphate dehydrogenase [Methylococcaceae bacterium]